MDLSRRTFLASAGGLVAASALPAFSKDDPSYWDKRGRFERISLVCQHVHIGLEKPFSILHISDSHITEADERDGEDKRRFAESRRRTFGGRQQSALLSSLDWAKSNVDYVVHTGDLIDFCSEANLDFVRNCFGNAAGFMLGSTGNHEYQRRNKGERCSYTPEYNALSEKALSSAFGFDTNFSNTVVNGVNFVAISQVYGYVTPNQVVRFKKEVAKGLPIVLCMHAPFLTDGILTASNRYWKYSKKKFSAMPAIPAPDGDAKRQRGDETTRNFIEYLKGEKLLKAILTGHLHVSVQERFSPTAMQYVVGGNFLFGGEEVFFT